MLSMHRVLNAFRLACLYFQHLARLESNSAHTDKVCIMVKHLSLFHTVVYQDVDYTPPRSPGLYSLHQHLYIKQQAEGTCETQRTTAPVYLIPLQLKRNKTYNPQNLQITLFKSPARFSNSCMYMPP